MHECYFSFLLATRSAMLGLAAFLTYQPRTAVSTMAVSHRLLSSTPTNKGRETSGMMHRWEMAVAAQGVPHPTINQVLDGNAANSWSNPTLPVSKDFTGNIRWLLGQELQHGHVLTKRCSWRLSPLFCSLQSMSQNYAVGMLYNYDMFLEKHLAQLSMANLTHSKSLLYMQGKPFKTSSCCEKELETIIMLQELNIVPKNCTGSVME